MQQMFKYEYKEPLKYFNDVFCHTGTAIVEVNLSARFFTEQNENFRRVVKTLYIRQRLSTSYHRYFAQVIFSSSRSRFDQCLKTHTG